jgi:transaldolase
VTAVLTLDQVREIVPWLAEGPSSYVSVFAGRVADTGVDPVPPIAAAVEVLRPYRNVELIWASPRETLNVLQADAVGCDVITLTPALLRKLSVVGEYLREYSRETVQMLYDDGQKAGYAL